MYLSCIHIEYVLVHDSIRWGSHVATAHLTHELVLCDAQGREQLRRGCSSHSDRARAPRAMPGPLLGEPWSRRPRRARGELGHAAHQGRLGRGGRGWAVRGGAGPQSWLAVNRAGYVLCAGQAGRATGCAGRALRAVPSWPHRRGDAGLAAQAGREPPRRGARAGAARPRRSRACQPPGGHRAARPRRGPRLHAAVPERRRAASMGVGAAGWAAPTPLGCWRLKTGRGVREEEAWWLGEEKRRWRLPRGGVGDVGGGGGSAPWRLSERRLRLGACAGGALGFGGGWATRQVARWVAGGGGGERGMGWAAGGCWGGFPLFCYFFLLLFILFLF
jgi:hypothetical protein